MTLKLCFLTGKTLKKSNDLTRLRKEKDHSSTISPSNGTKRSAAIAVRSTAAWLTYREALVSGTGTAILATL